MAHLAAETDAAVVGYPGQFDLPDEHRLPYAEPSRRVDGDETDEPRDAVSACVDGEVMDADGDEGACREPEAEPPAEQHRRDRRRAEHQGSELDRQGDSDRPHRDALGGCERRAARVLPDRPGDVLGQLCWKKTPAQLLCVSTPSRRRIESQMNPPAPTPTSETTNAPASASQPTLPSPTWLSCQIERSRTSANASAATSSTWATTRTRLVVASSAALAARSRRRSRDAMLEVKANGPPEPPPPKV
jgi:hypothetical protein